MTEPIHTSRALLETVGLSASSQTREAGYFDGIRTHVHTGNLHQSVVSAHEAIHERICISTPDGRVLFVMSGLAQSAAMPPHLKSICRRNRSELFSCSEYAHEVFATYLSTNSLRSVDVEDALKLYDATYSAYYSELATVLDGQITSTYLRFAVGWGMCIAVFSSGLIKRIPPKRLTNVLSLRPTERPTFRLKKMIDRIASHDLTEIVETCQNAWSSNCEELHQTSWDLGIEEAWVTNLEVAPKAEEVCIDQAATFFERVLGDNIVSKHTFVEWNVDCFTEHKTHLAALNIHTPEGSLASAIVKSIDDALAWYQAGSRIENRRRKNILVYRHDRIPPSGDLVAIRSEWDRQSRMWAVMFPHDMSRIADYALMTDAELSALAVPNQSDGESRRGSSERILLLVDSFPTEDDLMRFVSRTIQDDQPGNNAEYSKSLGYVHGNWLKCIGMLMDAGYSIRLGIAPTYECDFPTQLIEMPAEQGMVIYIMAVDGLPMLLIKAMNPVASTVVAKQLVKVFEMDEVRRFEVDQAERLWSLASLAMGFILSTWDSL